MLRGLAPQGRCCRAAATSTAALRAPVLALPRVSRQAVRVHADYSRADDRAREAGEAARRALQKGQEAARAAMGDFKMPALSNLKADIAGLVRINFLAQLFLTAISWAVVFLSTHAGLANGQNVTVPTIFLLLGVVLSGFSAFLSFGYFRKVQAQGAGVLNGMKVMDDSFDHMKINFAGIACTLVAMQAEIGTLFVNTMARAGAGSYSSIAAMAQASANIFTAHVVSLLFLTLIIQKITGNTKSLVEWSENMRAGLDRAINPQTF